MTPAEILAVELFGWEPCAAPTHSIQNWKKSLRWYSHPSITDRVAMIAANPKTGTEVAHIGRPQMWPDFYHERLKWYWIRRMEDALFARGYDVWGEYRRCLAIATADDGRNGLETRMLRATAEQKVAAAVKVLEGIESEKAKKAEQLERAKQRRQAVRAKAAELKKTMRCNCDLDNWVPEDISGHSHVCRIHKEAVKVLEGER